MKAYAKSNNCSYGDAMSRAKPSYHGKGGGILQDAYDWVKKHKVIRRCANLLIQFGSVRKHNGTIGKIGGVAHKHGYGKHC